MCSLSVCLSGLITNIAASFNKKKALPAALIKPRYEQSAWSATWKGWTRQTSVCNPFDFVGCNHLTEIFTIIEPLYKRCTARVDEKLPVPGVLLGFWARRMKNNFRQDSSQPCDCDLPARVGKAFDNTLILQCGLQSTATKLL